MAYKQVVGNDGKTYTVEAGTPETESFQVFVGQQDGVTSGMSSYDHDVGKRQALEKQHQDFWNQNGSTVTPTGQTPTGQSSVSSPSGGQTQYGGYAGGAADMSGLGLTNMNWAQGQASQDRGAQAFENQILSDREAQTRFGDQAGALQLHREAALGQAPSEAAFLMQSGLDRSLANQQAMAGGARGAAGIAMAQGNAQANAASMQNQAFTSAGALRAAEMAQARGAYGDMSNQTRQQDQNRLGMGNQMSQYNAGLNDQYKLGMGQLGLGYYNAAQRPHENQLSADTAALGYATGSADQAKALAAGKQQAQTDRNNQMSDRYVQAGGQALNMIGGGIAAGLSGSQPVPSPTSSMVRGPGGATASGSASFGSPYGQWNP